jgi:hypothetical protein
MVLWTSQHPLELLSEILGTVIHGNQHILVVQRPLKLLGLDGSRVFGIFSASTVLISRKNFMFLKHIAEL